MQMLVYLTLPMLPVSEAGPVFISESIHEENLCLMELRDTELV